MLLNDSVIYYSLAVGVLPALSFGSLTLTEEELLFKPDALPWSSGWGAAPVERIVDAQARPAGRPVWRRAVWLIGTLLFPIPGLAGLFWLPSYWRRAGNATLEVTVSRRWLRRNRVDIVDDPEVWAQAINDLITNT